MFSLSPTLLSDCHSIITTVIFSFINQSLDFINQSVDELFFEFYKKTFIVTCDFIENCFIFCNNKKVDLKHWQNIRNNITKSSALLLSILINCQGSNPKQIYRSMLGVMLCKMESTNILLFLKMLPRASSMRSTLPLTLIRCTQRLQSEQFWRVIELLEALSPHF